MPDDTPSSPDARPSNERRHAPRSPLIFRTDAAFPPLPQSAVEARGWCLDALRGWGLVSDFSAALAVCEDLVSFAVQFGTGEIEVRLSSGPRRITISVSRHGLPLGQPLPEEQRKLLTRVGALASSWGVRRPRGDIGTLWADVEVQP
ncbi:MAG TPA: hypothetical protein VGL60_13860 [Acidimicrobiales bacterium]